MNILRLCDFRVVVAILCVSLSGLAPPLALGQFASVVETNARYAGNSTGSSLYSGDTGTASSTSLNAPSYAVFDSLGNLYISDTANNCVRKIDPSGNITTVAGLRINGGPDTCDTSTNATPTPAQGLLAPTGLAIDSSNTLYIADSQHNCVRSLASGAVDSYAANALTTVAGTCTATDTASVTPVPNGLAVDSASNLYISIQDTAAASPVNQVLRHSSASPANTVCIMAGQPSANVVSNCAGVTGSLSLSSPAGLAIFPTGDLFIADTGNDCVREIAGLTTPQTAVGFCTSDHTGTAATALSSPYGLAFSSGGSLYISQSAALDNQVVSFNSNSTTLTLVAGLPSGTAGPYTTLQDGQSALSATLNHPLGLTTDSTGDLYVADSLNNVIRKLSTGLNFPTEPLAATSASQTITFAINQGVNLTASIGSDYSITANTCAGVLSAAASGAPPNTCQVTVTFTPLWPGARNSALVLNNSISGNAVSVPLIGTGTGPLSLLTPGIASSAATGLRTPVAVAVDSTGNAYVLEQGDGMTTANVVRVPAGGGSPQTVIPQGDGLVTPTAMAIDAAGNLFIADAAVGGVSRFGADGSVNTSFITGLTNVTALAVDASDNLYIAQSGAQHDVLEVYASSARRVIAGLGATGSANNVPAISALFVSPSGLALGPDGLSIADAGAHLVYTVDTAGIIHIVAGNGTTVNTSDTLATGTGLLLPASLATDAAGDIYIADQAANRVYEVYPFASSGVTITTVIGTGAAGYGGDGGPATSATLQSPSAVALDGAGDLFAADIINGVLREVTYPVSSTLNYNDVIIGTTSPAEQQAFANIGNASLSLTTPFTTTDTHYAVSTDPSITTCGSVLAPGGACAIGYTFTPTAFGPLNAQSGIASNSYNSPQTVFFTAFGLNTQVLPYTLTPATEVYGQPFTQTATIHLIYPDLTPTGTMAYTIAGETTCSTTGTFTTTVDCAASQSGIGVGDYSVLFTYTSGDQSYYSTTNTTTLTITPGTLTVSPSNVSKLYGAALPALPATTSGAVNGDIFLPSATTTATASSPVGAYPITATLTGVGLSTVNNYNVTYNAGTLTVKPAPLTVTVGSVSRIYGAANPTFSSTIVGAVNGDTFTVTYSTSATATSPAGAYPITATVTGPQIGNYVLTVLPGTLTIAPMPLTVTVAGATRPYGAANPTFSSTIIGAINGDTFTNSFSTTATAASYIGAYPITDTLAGPAAANYTITVVPGTLTVTKATLPLTVTANNATRAYAAANPTFTSTITGGLNGDSFTILYTTTATQTSPIGAYPIVPTVTGPAAANYNVVTNNGTLTVADALNNLVVTVANAARTFGALNPVFTGTVAGLLNGDTVSVVYSTAATPSSPAGSYPIIATVSGAAAANYNVTVLPGTLAISAAATSTALATSASPADAGAVVTFTATVNSPAGTPTGAVTFLDGATPLGTAALDASGVAIFTTSALSAGTHTITATYQSSPSFISSSGTVTQVINPVGFTIAATPPSQFIRGPGSTSYVITATSVQNFSGNVVLSCSGLPADATCTFTNPTLALTSGATASTTMTIVNTAADAELRFPSQSLPAGRSTTGSGSNAGSFAPISFAAVFPFEFTGLGVFFAGFNRKKKRIQPTRSTRLLLMLVFSIGLLGLAGCACFTSVYKNYTVTVTGVSSVAGAESQSTSVILSVGAQ